MPGDLVIPQISTLGPGYAEAVSALVQRGVGVDATDPQFAGGVQADGAHNDAAALLSLRDYCLPRGKAIFLPDGVIVCDQTIEGITDDSLPGLKVIGPHKKRTQFDTRVANAPLFNLDITTLYRFATGARLEGFGIMSTAPGPNASGISYRGQWNKAFRGLEIFGLTGDGITQVNNGDHDEFGNPTGDPDASAELEWTDVEVHDIDGIGFNCPDPAIMNGSGLWSPTRVAFQKCKGGGFRYIGLGVEGQNVSASWNGNFGMQLPESQRTTVFTLNGGVFDGNEFYNFDIRSCLLFLLTDLDSISRDSNEEYGFDWINPGAQPSTMFNIGAGAGGAVSCGHIERTRVRNTRPEMVNVFYYGAEAARQSYKHTFYESSSTYLNKVTDLMAPGNLQYEDTDPAAGSGEYLRTMASRAMHRGAPFGIPPGVAPSDSAAGDMWTTGSGLFTNRGGLSRQVALLEDLLGGQNTWTAKQILNAAPTLNTWLDITEQADPAAPLDSVARLFVRRTGGGKSQLVMKTEAGEVIIATEP